MEYFSKFANVLGYIYPQKTIDKKDDNLNLLNKNKCSLLNKNDFDQNIEKIINEQMFYKNRSNKIIKFNEKTPLIKRSKKITFIRKNSDEED